MNQFLHRKIFLVDDDTFCQAIYEQHLLNLGYTNISVFSSGTDLLECLDENPDLIFLDYNLDDYTGAELLTKIKEKNPDTYVVMVSGQSDIEITVSLMNKGAFDYIVKNENETEKISAVIAKWVLAMEFSGKFQAKGEGNPAEKYLNVIMEAQEKVRKEISNELHDNVSQLLGATKLYIESARDDEKLRNELLNDSKRFIESAIREIRRISHSLVSNVAYADSFSDALSNLFSFLLKQNRFKVENSINVGILESYLNKEQQHHVVRILQEMINNTIKYSEASVFTLKAVVNGGQLEMIVSDNGKGFDQSAGRSGIGVSNISERIKSMMGNFILDTAPGRGCTWKISIPLKNYTESSRFSVAV